MMGAEGLVTLESPEAHRGGLIEEALRHSPVTAIYGGTSEINRNMVAEGFLGLLGLAERPADGFSSSGDAGPSARCWAARARPRDRIRRCGCSPTG